MSTLRNRKPHQQKKETISTDLPNQILWFHQLNHKDAYRVGGKGANLGECTSANLPVPNGFVITGSAFDQQLAKYQMQVGTADPASARNVLLNEPLDDRLVKAIGAAYLTLGGLDGSSNKTSRGISNSHQHQNPLVAVRSSATAEDGAAASFAGQMETLLGVSTVSDVMSAVRLCWASVFADRVAAYRTLAGGAGSCCVVVQLMVEADAAGVMFTANPLSGARDEFVVTANWGIGESVVADLTTPDTFVLDSTTGAVLSTDIGTKKMKVVLVREEDLMASTSSSEETSKKTLRVAMAEEVPVPLHLQQVPCITQENLTALLKLGRKVLDHYDDIPQDIEWAIVKNQVLLLQARPITTLSNGSEQGSADSDENVAVYGTVGEFDWHCQPNDWLTTCNAQEMFPGAGTPLTISVFGGAVEYGMQSLHMDYIRTMPGFDSNVLRTGWFNGHFFINMTNTLYMLTQMLGGEMGKANGEMSILGRMNNKFTMEQLQQVHGAPWFPIRLFNSLGYLYAVRQASTRIDAMQRRANDAPRLLGVAEYKNEEKDTAMSVYVKLAAYRSEYDQQWADGIMCGSTSAAWMLMVMKLVCRSDEMWSTARVSEIADALVSDPNGEEQVESADAVRQLDILKESIAKHVDAKLFVHDWNEKEGQAWLEGVGNGDNNADEARSAITRTFSSLLQRHGHRCVKEAEFRNEDWGENPEVLVKLLKNSVKAELKVLKAATEAAAQSDSGYGSGSGSGSGSGTILPPPLPSPEETDKLEILLKNEWSHIGCCWRPLLRYAVYGARAGVRRREMSKSLQVKVHSSMKRGFRWLGQLMVREQLISDCDLLYFLTFEELGDLIRPSKGSSVSQDIKMRAIKRRRLLPKQQKMTFPDLIQGKPVPNPPRMFQAAGKLGFSVVGTPVSRGDCEGYARVVRTLEEASDLEPGEILICPFTDVGWTPYFSLASGLVTEIGGLLSHGAVVAREYGLPCIVNVEDACSRFQTGMLVSIHGSTGKITVLAV